MLLCRTRSQDVIFRTSAYCNGSAGNKSRSDWLIGIIPIPCVNYSLSWLLLQIPHCQLEKRKSYLETWGGIDPYLGPFVLEASRGDNCEFHFKRTTWHAPGSLLWQASEESAVAKVERNENQTKFYHWHCSIPTSSASLLNWTHSIEGFFLGFVHNAIAYEFYFNLHSSIAIPCIFALIEITVDFEKRIKT